MLLHKILQVLYHAYKLQARPNLRGLLLNEQCHDPYTNFLLPKKPKQFHLQQLSAFLLPNMLNAALAKMLRKGNAFPDSHSDHNVIFIVRNNPNCKSFREPPIYLN